METNIPDIFDLLLSYNCVEEDDIIKTEDGFFMLNKSMAAILARKDIFEFSDPCGEMLLCDRFFDDWFIYAVRDEVGYIYSLLKLREQEHDTEDGSPADGDTPGVTISFVAFDCKMLLDCLTDPSPINSSRLNIEINRVVVYKKQRHHKALKRYFKNPHSIGAYLVADVYVKTIASYYKNGYIIVPEHYKQIVQQSISYKNSTKFARLPRFIEELNDRAGYVVCDNEKIYIGSSLAVSEYESLAILATHMGNTSVYSFAAEVEYHAKFLTSLAKVKIPFFGRSIYDSAIRADMTVGDSEFEGSAPFYKSNSEIVKRQYALHNK